ncbi:MAG: hypothetical protein ACRDJ9_30300, partial [Dehalococcoidia bacterium]
MPLQPSRQKQTGDVGAGNEKQERNGSEKRHQESAPVAIEDVFHRRGGGTDALKRRVGLPQPGGDRGELRLRLCERRTIPQARDGVPGTVGGPRLVRRHAEPEVDMRVQVVVGLARRSRVR